MAAPTGLPLAPIGTIPRGLLDLLGLKQLGKNPDLLNSNVDPQIDMRDFWFNQVEQDTLSIFGGQPHTAALVSGNTGFRQLTIAGNQAQVPNNEIWYVRAAGLTLDTNALAAATDTIRAGLGVSTGTAGFSVLITPATQDNVTARANRFWMTEPMPGPTWLAPGTLFWAFVFDLGLAAGSQQLDLSMRAIRLRI